MPNAKPPRNACPLSVKTAKCSVRGIGLVRRIYIAAIPTARRNQRIHPVFQEAVDWTFLPRREAEGSGNGSRHSVARRYYYPDASFNFPRQWWIFKASRPLCSDVNSLLLTYEFVKWFRLRLQEAVEPSKGLVLTDPLNS